VPHENPFPYVSYSSPPISTDYSKLLTAANIAPQSLMIDEFDYREFAKTAADVAPPEVPDTVADGPQAVAEQLFEVLADDRYRNGPHDFIMAARDRIIRLTTEAVRERRPLRIVVPSFPGRPVNLLRHIRQQPDLGEAAALVRLWRMNLAVQRIHPPGLRWVIVMDGVAYSKFYGYATPPYHAYQADLQQLSERLGVSEAFEFTDLAALLTERQVELDALKPEVTKEVAAAWSDPDFSLRTELIHAMKLGTNTAPMDAAAIQHFTFPAEEVKQGRDPDTVKDLVAAIEARTDATAFAYTCLLVNMRRIDLFGTKFPDAIRATVHPKPGQYSPYLVSDRTHIVPWHGVAVRDTDGHVRSVYESEVLASPAKYRAVYIRGEYTPLFYESMES
jgi:pyoverdine/dityrosine biosynthesis protein Dit1